MPNFTGIEETFFGRTDGRMDGRTFETSFVRSSLSKCRPTNSSKENYAVNFQCSSIHRSHYTLNSSTLPRYLSLITIMFHRVASCQTLKFHKIA